ncbi:lipopolysaccharide biosynthesis protein [Deinococcus radiophilus]|nr:lipopolysaccharide biosynthesis protein [Deinococcus radiophilus]UFA51776.1 lipopolysaccharide biosynthesis protein [Deinococcus radiophilus]
MIWTVIGQGIYSASQWAAVILLAQVGGQVDVGLYALGLALTAPLFLFLGLQLRSVQATDIQGDFSFSNYFSLRLPLMGAGLLITAGLAFLYPHASGAVWWLGVAKALEGISEVMYGLMQRQHRLDWTAQSTLLRGVLGLGLLAAAYLLTQNLTLAALGLAVAALLTLVLFDWPRARRLEPARWWQPGPQPALIRLTLPLGMVIALVSLSTNLPRLVTEYVLGSAALGIYATLSYVGVIGSVLIVALGTSLTTRLSQLYAHNDRRSFLKLSGLLFAGAGGIGLLLVLTSGLAGEPLIHLLYGAEFAAEPGLFFWLCVAAAVGYLASALGFAMTAARQFSEQLPLFVAVTAVLILACAWFIPHRGLLGVAWATLLGAVTQLVGSAFILRRALRAPPVRAAKSDGRS